MKTKEILELDNNDVMKLSKTDLKSALQQINNVANIRLKKLESLGVEAPSIAGGVEKFSTRGKDLNQMRAEFVRVRNFLQAETSTIGKSYLTGSKGFKEFRKEMSERTGGAMSADINVAESEVAKENKMWKVYNKLVEAHPGKMMTVGSSPEVLSKIKKEVDENPGMSSDEIVNKAEDMIEKMYVEGVEQIEAAQAAELADATEFLI